MWKSGGKTEEGAGKNHAARGNTGQLIFAILLFAVVRIEELVLAVYLMYYSKPVTLNSKNMQYSIRKEHSLVAELTGEYQSTSENNNVN